VVIGRRVCRVSVWVRHLNGIIGEKNGVCEARRVCNGV
jgi:hypothetical protein